MTAALLEAIVDHPDDLDLRLIYADALSDAGYTAKEEFVRVGCELATLQPRKHFGGSAVSSFTFHRGRGGVLVYTDQPIVPGDRFDLEMPADEVRFQGGKSRFFGLLVENNSRRMYRRGDSHQENYIDFVMDEESRPWKGESLQRRSDELLALHEPSWLPFRTRRQERQLSEYQSPPIAPAPDITWTAGFVSAVECRLSAWLGETCWRCQDTCRSSVFDWGTSPVTLRCDVCHGRKRLPGIGTMLRDHPVREVVTERKPSQYTSVGSSGDSWYWCEAYGDTMHLPDRLPQKLARLLKGWFRERDGVYQYQAEAAALSALSDALIEMVKPPKT